MRCSSKTNLQVEAPPTLCFACYACTVYCTVRSYWAFSFALLRAFVPCDTVYHAVCTNSFNWPGRPNSTYCVLHSALGSALSCAFVNKARTCYTVLHHSVCRYSFNRPGRPDGIADEVTAVIYKVAGLLGPFNYVDHIPGTPKGYHVPCPYLQPSFFYLWAEALTRALGLCSLPPAESEMHKT